jgi:hypothetical protein
MIALYSWSVKVTIEEGNITKSSLLGKKSFPVKSIDEITHIALMGRYSFLLITPETFLAISSLLENFAQLSGYLKDNLTDEAYKNMGVITPTMLDRKTLYMKGIMVVLIAISIAAIVYRVISTDFRL